MLRLLLIFSLHRLPAVETEYLIKTLEILSVISTLIFNMLWRAKGDDFPRGVSARHCVIEWSSIASSWLLLASRIVCSLTLLHDSFPPYTLFGNLKKHCCGHDAKNKKIKARLTKSPSNCSCTLQTSFTQTTFTICWHFTRLYSLNSNNSWLHMLSFLQYASFQMIISWMITRYLQLWG